MFSKAFSATIQGIEGVIISVEADVSDGLPIFDMVGYLASEVREARERVRIALKNSGYRLQAKRITVNLSPADIRKEGTAFDLPVAIAILTAFGHIVEEGLQQTLIIGELSLNGNLNQVNGVLPIVYSAKQQGFFRCIVPIDNVMEGAVVQGIEVYGVATVKEAVDLINGGFDQAPQTVDIHQMFTASHKEENLDFADVSGQLAAKRAIEVAVAGQHNIMILCCNLRGMKSAVFKHLSTTK